MEEMINGNRLVAKTALLEFFDWNNPAFCLTDFVALGLEEQVFENNILVVINPTESSL
jgi:hypothetical protein